MKTFNDNYSHSTEFVVVDLEFLYDHELYRRYAARDPRPAPMRWPVRRVVSASVMALRAEDGILEVAAFKSWSGPDEAKIVAGLFRFLAERPFARLCSWSGITADVPVLRVAAQEHGLKLPRQLRSNVDSRSVHLDLAHAMKGGERNHVHMSEIANRLGIPSKMGGSAAKVPLYAALGEHWRIEHISEADVISTGMLLCAWLAAEGELMSGKAAQLALLQFVRPMRARAPYARILGNVADRLRSEIQREIAEAMRRVA